MDEPAAQSPTPLETKPIVLEQHVDFPEAMRQVINGKKVTKFEWQNREIYGYLDGAILSLHKADGKTYRWIISDGDMLGTDWIAID